MVRAARLGASEIVDALERGDFYSTTGVVLDEVSASAREVRVVVRADGTTKFRIKFIGRQGRVLAEFTTLTATYAIKGDEGYVRAKVLDSNGHVAWTQPVLVTRSAP